MTMTAAELAMLHQQVGRATRYLEFGSGESTLFALSVSTIVRIDSVESSPEFVRDRLLSQLPVREAISTGRLRFHLVNIGPTVAWGRPADTRLRHLWPNYALSVFAQPHGHDVVLVDGRFRVACILSTLLNIPGHARIVVHDFWNRPWYHVVLEFLDVIERVDTLAVLAPKPGFNVPAVQSMLADYLYEPE